MNTARIRQLYPHLRQMFSYGIIGACSAGCDFAVYTLVITLFHCYYLAANCLSVLIGIAISFALNRSFTFRVKDRTWRRFVTFLTVGLSGLALSNALLWFGVEQLGQPEIITKLLTIMLVALVQFLFNKFITFHPL